MRPFSHLSSPNNFIGRALGTQEAAEPDPDCCHRHGAAWASAPSGWLGAGAGEPRPREPRPREPRPYEPRPQTLGTRPPRSAGPGRAQPPSAPAPGGGHRPGPRPSLQVSGHLTDARREVRHAQPNARPGEASPGPCGKGRPSRPARPGVRPPDLTPGGPCGSLASLPKGAACPRGLQELN